ncbi:MAG: hypothetical protein IPM11_14975 [Micropruina sp.]|nr:hypothetical protein [Micropruina sp.]
MPQRNTARPHQTAVWGSRLAVGALLTFVVVVASDLTALESLSELPRVGVAVLAVAAALMIPRRPVQGALLAIPPIFACLVWPSAADTVLTTLVIAVFAAKRPWRELAAALGVSFAYLAAHVSINPGRSLTYTLTFFAVVWALALGIGVAIRGYYGRQAESRATISALESELERVRTDERHALSRDLHGVVAYQLAIMTSEVAAHGGSRDVTELRGALERVETATRSALIELRGLLGVLRQEGTAMENLEVELGRSIPSVCIDRIAATLRGHGFHVASTCEDGIDELEPSLRRTLCRIAQETAANVLRHAPAGACYAVRLTLDGDSAQVRVESSRDVEATVREAPAGFGLRGLRERVSLVGGTFSAIPEGPTWVVTATLPVGGAPLPDDLIDPRPGLAEALLASDSALGSLTEPPLIEMPRSAGAEAGGSQA